MRLVEYAISKTKDSLENMDVIYSYDYKVLKNVSSLSGLWPYQKTRTKLFYSSITTLSILSIGFTQVILDNF